MDFTRMDCTQLGKAYLESFRLLEPFLLSRMGVGVLKIGYKTISVQSIGIEFGLIGTELGNISQKKECTHRPPSTA